MGQRYLNPSDRRGDYEFRLITLVKKENGNKTSSMTVAVDNSQETLKFFQENVREVIQNVRMVKQLEAIDSTKFIEEPSKCFSRGYNQ